MNSQAFHSTTSHPSPTTSSTQRPVAHVSGPITNFISNSDLFRDIFLDMDTYTNNGLMQLSFVCACLTDVTYWQFTLVFKRWRWPRYKSQLQIHNRGLTQCHSFTGHSHIFPYEQLKLVGAASDLLGDHGPAKSLFFSAQCNLPPHSQTSGHDEPCRASRNRWYQTGSFRHRCLSISHSSDGSSLLL